MKRTTVGRLTAVAGLLVAVLLWPAQPASGIAAQVEDESSASWAYTGKANGWHIRGAAALLLDGRVLVVSGNANSHSEVYHPVTQLWTKTRPSKP